jgi:hypothetical protein
MEQLKRDSSGFRLRGHQPTGIQAFTDAAFAFALSLLVISLTPPTSLAQLQRALAGMPAFLASATMLMMFWWGHHVWSRRYGLDDGRTVMLSALLVFTVLVYVYPLRFVFSLMFEWLGWVFGIHRLLDTEATVSSGHDVNALFTIYGVGFAAMSGIIVLLHLHAWSQRDVLALDEVERYETRANAGAWLILTGAGVLSVFVALVVPARMAGLPGWVYALLGIVMPFYGRWVARRQPHPPAPETYATETAVS